jgi:hypothetical protein
VRCLRSPLLCQVERAWGAPHVSRTLVDRVAEPHAHRLTGSNRGKIEGLVHPAADIRAREDRLDRHTESDPKPSRRRARITP